MKIKMKKAYEKPVLTEYGSIRELTKTDGECQEEYIYYMGHIIKLNNCPFS